MDEQAGQPTSLLSQLLFHLNAHQYVVARRTAATQRSEGRCTWSELLGIQILSLCSHDHQEGAGKKNFAAAITSCSNDSNYIVITFFVICNDGL